MEIPYQRLSESALRGLVEEFVTRDGTDYGETEVPLDRRVAEVLRQLERGEACVVFDPATETTSIVKREALAARPAGPVRTP